MSPAPRPVLLWRGGARLEKWPLGLSGLSRQNPPGPSAPTLELACSGLQERFWREGKVCRCGFVHGLSFHPLSSGAPALLGSLTCLLGRLLLNLGTVSMCRPEPRDMTTGCDCSDRPVRAPQTPCPLRCTGAFRSDGKGPRLLTDLTGSSASSSQSGG